MAGAFKSLRRGAQVLEISEDEDDEGLAPSAGDKEVNWRDGMAHEREPNIQMSSHQGPRSKASRAKRARQAEKEEMQQAAATAMSKAAEASFQVLAAADSSITAEALRKALIRFRIPPEVCKPEEAEDLLEVAAEQAKVPPGSLSFESFKKLFHTLNLKVTKDGRVW
ncbi:Endoglucanase EG-1 [Durusdinium trenchii]|uniref:Endoglucanase EG-1 n=1 Tax=Durusdinium trenchii TaxID=1381693 RepID=A0ABP0LJA4_9DINO